VPNHPTCGDTDGDRDNCGFCGNACKDGVLCWRGACGCPNGYTQCGDDCKKLDSDRDNCGACGKMCPSNICLKGVCQGATPGVREVAAAFARRSGHTVTVLQPASAELQQRLDNGPADILVASPEPIDDLRAGDTVHGDGVTLVPQFAEMLSAREQVA